MPPPEMPEWDEGHNWETLGEPEDSQYVKELLERIQASASSALDA